MKSDIEKMDEIGPGTIPMMTALLNAIGDVKDGGEVQQLRVTFTFDHEKKEMDMTIHEAKFPGGQVH